jgi:hypothetical protein
MSHAQTSGARAGMTEATILQQHRCHYFLQFSIARKALRGGDRNRAGCEDGAVAYIFERIVRRRFEQLADLPIAECRDRAFVAVGHRPLDAVDRISSGGVVLTEIVEQGAEREELAADAGGGEFALLQVLSPGDDVGTSHSAQLGDAAEAGEGAELLEIALIGPASFGIGEIADINS